jgi:GNAT superfamily N-acetyltransferase
MSVTPGPGRGPRGASRTRAGASLRPATRADVEACLSIFYDSMEDLLRSRGEPVTPRNPIPLAQLFEHLIGTDPAGSWVADGSGRPVAFGLSHVRGSSWFLAMLFVLPGWQARGIGRLLLERCLESAPDERMLGTCVEAVQPVSTALYASYGMLPRVPQYAVGGTPRAGSLPPLPEDVEALSFDALAGAEGGSAALETTLARIDREMLGHAHPQDHAFWQRIGRHGFLYRVPGAGETGDRAIGYGYAHQSGRIGPVAALDALLLPAIIGHLTTAIRAADAWLVNVPGPAGRALVPLLRAGLRILPGPVVYAGSWPGPAFDRYLPMGYALL